MTAVSRFAFLCSVQRLFAEADSGVSLWTLTFPGVGVHSWSYASTSWGSFRRRCIKARQPLRGVRVAELHPGGHGWHIHYLTDCYHRVEGFRARAQACSFGRVNVVFLGEKSPGMALYLAKHFRKDFGRESMGGCRWYCVGDFVGTRCSDVEVRSTFRDWVRARLRLAGKSRAGFVEFQRLRHVWLFGMPKKRNLMEVLPADYFTTYPRGEALGGLGCVAPPFGYGHS